MSTLCRNIPGVISSFQYYIYSLRDKARNGCFFRWGIVCISGKYRFARQNLVGVRGGMEERG